MYRPFFFFVIPAFLFCHSDLRPGIFPLLIPMKMGIHSFPPHSRPRSGIHSVSKKTPLTRGVSRSVGTGGLSEVTKGSFKKTPPFGILSAFRLFSF